MLTKSIKSWILYSDSCAEQKNKSVLAIEKFMVDSTAIEKVTHTFMVPRHAHMGVRCGARHDRKSKKNVALCMFLVIGTTSSRWPKQTNRTFSLRNSKPAWFSVGKKVAARMLKFPAKFGFGKIRCFLFRKGSSTMVAHRDGVAELHSVGLLLRSGDEIQLLPAYASPLAISKEKKEDLDSLMKYVPATYHHYFLNIKSSFVQVDTVQWSGTFICNGSKYELWFLHFLWSSALQS